MQRPKTCEKKKKKIGKNIETIPRKIIFLLANISDTLFNQKSLVHQEAGFLQWHTHTHTQLMDIATLRLNRPSGLIQLKLLLMPHTQNLLAKIYLLLLNVN